jgi:hypothetical protein
MRKIKRFLALLLVSSALTSAFATGADVVVLMDSSGTILPYFEEINSRVLVDITKKFIRVDDTFHLISFNSRVNLEIVQPVKSEEDVSRIVSRFMLLYPLGQNSDFISGLHYTWQYVSSLEQNREKIIIIISDGIFNPPASSPYATFTPEQIKSEISQISQKIRGAGWSVFYIKLPFPENAEIYTLDGNRITNGESAKESGTQTSVKDATTSEDITSKDSGQERYTDISSEFTESLDIPQSTLPAGDVPGTFVDSVFTLPEVEFPGDLGKKGRVFDLPLKIKNTAKTPINMELTGVYSNEVNLLAKNSFLTLSPGAKGTLTAELRLPPTILKGSQDLPVRLEFSDNMRVIPQNGIIHLTVTGLSLGILFRTGSSIVLAIVFILLALILIVVLFKFIVKKTARPASDAIDSAYRAEQAEANERPAVVPAAQSNEKLPTRTGTAQKQEIPSAGKTQTGDRLSVHDTTTKTAQSLSVASNTTADVQATLANARGNGTTGLSANTKPVVEDRRIAYTVEKIDSSREIDTLASQQKAETQERFAVLDSAAKKPAIQSAHFAGANANARVEIRKNANIMLELNVPRQNPNIGKRNIHVMKAGSKLGIGGGASSFLIFLVKFPSNIAEIRYDGEQCSLAILKPEYFPYEKDNIIENCVNKTFRVVSDKAYEVEFAFTVFEDPATRINRILTSFKY